MSWRASDGLRAWVFQRVSAAYLALCVIAFCVAGAFNPPLSYPVWHAWFAHPVVSVAAAMFFLALATHAWVGMRDVILDYVHAAGVRFLALTAVAFILMACVLWALRILILAA
jgi:succinate dehydrogenase / fumarate reductase, membrane anchor subunit